MLKLVPFNPSWITHERIDIKAIYRRPRFVEDQYGDFERELGPDGLPAWDLTTPLPVKQHSKWAQKGFEYVTLASRNDLVAAAKEHSVANWKEYDQHATGGPWNIRLYLEGQVVERSDQAAQIASDVERFGPEAVESIRRQTDPTFRLPEHLRAAEAEPVAEGVAPRRPGRPRKSEATEATA